MLIHKPRPLPIKLARGAFYLVFNGIKFTTHKFITPQGGAVKVFVLNQAGQILLVKIGYAHRSWVLPGGSIDKGESPEVAAKRELQEESGLQLDDLKPAFVRPHTEYKKVHLHYYFGRTDTDDITIDDQEIIDGGWFDLDQLPEPKRPKLELEINLLRDWLNAKA